MKVVCNADITVDFDLHKDVSIPRMLIGGNQSYLDVGNLDPEERDILAFYASQMHGKVRPKLIKHWKNKDPDMKVYEVLPPSIALNMSYVAHMRRNKFCLCPKGFEVNNPRIVESIMNGCVHVIIADHFVLPFSDVLNWSKFSITVLEKDILDLKEIDKGDLQHSLLTQSPFVCGKNLKIPFKKIELFQSGYVHSGKTIPFPMRGFPKCS